MCNSRVLILCCDIVKSNQISVKLFFFFYILEIIYENKTVMVITIKIGKDIKVTYCNNMILYSQAYTYIS
jgi:hypothetical protein